MTATDRSSASPPSDSGSSQDDDELTLNPTFVLKLASSARIKGQVCPDAALTQPSEIRVAAWFLELMSQARGGEPGDVELPEELIDTAVRMGLLVPRSSLPPPIPRYRCDLDPELLRFLPSATPDEWRQHDLAAYQKNPRMFVQTTRDLPFVSDTLQWRQWKGVDWRKRGVTTELSSDLPIVWVENRSGILEPFWCGGPFGTLLRDLATDRRSARDLPSEARPFFHLANVLVPAAEPRPAAPSIARDGYALLKGALSPLQVAAVRRYFRAVREAGCFSVDDRQVVGRRDGMYSDRLTSLLQSIFCPLISEVTRTRLCPTFTWVFRYRDGAVLARHTDREQCRWNVSLCIDREGPPDAAPWPLGFSVDGADQLVSLDVGDAVLYSGTETPHWRDALPSEQAVTVCLFHYIEADMANVVRDLRPESESLTRDP